MDTDHCPKCDAKAVVAGNLNERSRGGGRCFEPTGMRFFQFRWRQGVYCPEPIQACLKCGHVWTDLQPEDLRTFIDKHGTAKTKVKLAPFRKAPPEQELI
jgi:hypothetical protein